jgi:hypothetical protein
MKIECSPEMFKWKPFHTLIRQSRENNLAILSDPVSSGDDSSSDWLTANTLQKENVSNDSG